MLTWLTWLGLAVAVVGLIFGFGFLYVSSRKGGDKVYSIVGWVFFALGIVGIILMAVGLALNDSNVILSPGGVIYYQSDQIVNTSTNSDIVIVNISGEQIIIGVSNNTTTTNNNVVVSTTNVELKYVLRLQNNSANSYTVNVYPGGNSPLTWSGPFEST